jgi:hypothetical protein
MKLPEFKRSGIGLIPQFRRILNGFPNQGHNLELTLEVILDHKLGIKTVTLVLSPGSCSKSLSLPRN